MIDQPVVIVRRYGSEGPEWTLPINDGQAAEHLLNVERLGDADRAPLLNATETTDKLRKTLAGIPQRTEAQERLLTRLNSFPGKNATGRITQVLQAGFPRFMSLLLTTTGWPVKFGLMICPREYNKHRLTSKISFSLTS